MNDILNYWVENKNEAKSCDFKELHTKIEEMTNDIS